MNTTTTRRRVAHVAVIALLAAGAAATTAATTAAATTGILVVSGNGANPPAADAALVDRITGLGFDPVVVDDQTATPSDATGMAAVIISSTIVPNALGSGFESLPVPLLVFEPFLFDDLGMTKAGGANRGQVSNRKQIQILDDTSPLAAGLSGRVTVTSRNSGLTWGRPGAGAEIVAGVPGQINKSVAFWYETGAQMFGAAAPARRVGLFPTATSGSSLTADGAALFDAAITLATSGDDPDSSPSNSAPTVDAGAPIDAVVGQPVLLDGVVSDDGLPNPPAETTVSWTGPPGVDFAMPGAAVTDVTLPDAGSYELVLTADDGELTESDSITVTVRDAPAVTGLDIVYIAANASGLAAERPLIERLRDAGNTVTVINDNGAGPTDAAGADLVLVSSSISAATFDAGWRDVAVPMVVWEPFVFDDMGWTANGKSQGSASGQTDVRIVNSDHPITAGLDGRVRVSQSGRALSWGKPLGDVTLLARHVNAPVKTALFTYDAGDEMAEGTAPARRVGLFLAANGPNALTDLGWDLVDRSIAWAAAPMALPPTAAVRASTTTGRAPRSIEFSGAGSTGDIVGWSWAFGDGATGSGADVAHEFALGGVYDVVLTVTDRHGRQATASTAITIENPPPRGADDPIVTYDFLRRSDGAVVDDVSGVGVPLHLTIADPDNVRWLNGGGLRIDTATKLESAGPATKVIEAVARTEAISIEAWVDPLNTNQSGPARIVALSNGDNESQTSNVMLGQGHKLDEADRVEGRFHTTTTTQHGTPGVLSQDDALDGELVHLVFTRSATGTERIFVNGTLSSEWQISGEPSPWDVTTPLLLANERSSNRPWRGDFHVVNVFERDLGVAEVCSRASAGPGHAISGNIAPFGCALVTGDGVAAPATVDFDGSGSFDLDGTITSMSWDLGDGTTTTGQQVQHRYEQPGTYSVTITVQDDDGAARSTSTSVEVIDGMPTPVRSIPEVSGMRVGNGFFKLDPHVAKETWLGRELSWTAQFTDHRSADDMGSSSNGLFARGNAQLPGVSERMNLSVTVGLAFGAEDLNNGGPAAVAANLQRTIDGEYDFLYFRVAERMVDAGYGDAVVRLGHEFNGGWPPWAATGNEDLYIAAYRHVHGLFRNMSPDYRFDWTAMKNNWGSTAPQAYPGDEFVDIVGVSIYWKADNSGLGTWSDATWRDSYLAPMSAARDFAVAQGKQMSVPEWGILGLDDPRFIDAMFAFVDDLPDSGPGSMAYNVYWDSGIPNVRLDAHPAVKNRYRELFG